MLAPLVENLSPGSGFLVLGAAFIALFILRYAVFAGGALSLISLFKAKILPRRLQPFGFSRAQLIREAGYSMLSMLIFGGVSIGAFMLNKSFGVYQIYHSISDYGWIWFWLSIPLALLIHDFYFYWAHRLMHVPGIYERVHKVHHLSTNPSPLAAFAFHPLEALVEAFGFILIMVVMPIHPLAFLAVSTVMIVYNVMGHLGYELLPRGLPAVPIVNLMNTATSHNQHHRTFSYNYGLYTLFWDRLFGTLHPRYSETFDTATRSKALATSP